MVRVFAVYLMCYAATRSFVEIYRGDYTPEHLFHGLVTPAQLASIIGVTIGAILLWKLPKPGNKPPSPSNGRSRAKKRVNVWPSISHSRTIFQAGLPIYLAGPTAVGKSAVALELAQYVNGEIISVDSMQVYRGMDIGTAKATIEERARVACTISLILLTFLKCSTWRNSCGWRRRRKRKFLREEKHRFFAGERDFISRRCWMVWARRLRQM